MWNYSEHARASREELALIEFRLPVSLLHAVNEEARLSGRTRAALIREALIHAVETVQEKRLLAAQRRAELSALESIEATPSSTHVA